MMAGGGVKSGIKRAFRGVFETAQHLGVDILPRHFYSEIPDLKQLKRDPHWKRPFSMIGVQGTDLEAQLQFVRECCGEAVAEAIRARDIHAEACAANGAVGYGPVEADFLYAFVRTRQPAEIFQIGCGVSTAICLMAARDAGYRPRIRCVEPYPTPFLQAMERDGEITLFREKAQALDPERIEALGEDLLFFVDSSHTLGPAGEVSRIILEMLPRLKRGAWVHFHDIMFPYDYDRHVLRESLFFQHESVLLHAFLACNPRFTIKGSLSMLHYRKSAELAMLLPRYRPAGNDEGLQSHEGHFPSATYLRVVA